MRSMAQDAFGRAASLALPNTSVASSKIFELAVDVVKRGRFDAGEARRLLARDQASDPLREALDELEETLNSTVSNPRDRQRIFDMCTRIASARDAAGGPQGGMETLEAVSAASFGKPSDQERDFGVRRKDDWPDGSASDRRRGQAADSRPGPLDELFKRYPAPQRL
jgi:hypothetical protein